MAKGVETRQTPCNRQLSDNFGTSVPFAGKGRDYGPTLPLVTRSAMQGSRRPSRSEETISFPTPASGRGQNGLRLRIMVQCRATPSAGTSLR